MASIIINLGDAFLLDTPPNSEHLYIAIAQTSESSYLFVNVTSRRPNSEDACILLPGSGLPSFINLLNDFLLLFAKICIPWIVQQGNKMFIMFISRGNELRPER